MPLTTEDTACNNTVEALKLLRAALGKISQEALAQHIGITLRTISRWEKGDAVSASGLARLYFAALKAGNETLVDFFQVAISRRMDMGTELGDFTPRNAEEMKIVGWFLRLWRIGRPFDKDFADIVRQLEEWSKECR
jgi:transcriptional regulator with XRE-family HTH domain